MTKSKKRDLMVVESWFFCRLLVGVTACFSLCVSAAELRWWKGNTHTHSLWSDGDQYPEMIVEWYRQHGYQFLALSDHNVMLVGERWIDAVTNKGGEEGLRKYLERFGTNWVERREAAGRQQVRLKTLEEFRGKFEEPGHFLMIPGEEMNASFGKKPIHLNATNLRKVLQPKTGNSPYEVIQNNINAILDQRKETGEPIIPHINHPNFEWSLAAEDIMRVEGERFLEIFNGHPITRNYGDTNHAGHERIWDIVLTRRLAEFGMEPMWGTAVDDAHNYHEMKIGHSNPGRGWIMVRAAELSAPALIAAMEKGEFYASSGVTLKDVRREKAELAIEIQTEPGVTYMTQFIGTRKGYDPSNEPVMIEGQPVHTTHHYSKDIGTVLAEENGANPRYKLKGDEIYVRAKVISSKRKENPMAAGDVESAWTQPVVSRAR
jgi:hypothetical protein